MKLFLGGLLVLIAVKYAAAHHVRFGVSGALLLWILLAYYFSKHIGSPLPLVRKHGRRLLRLTLHRRVRFPLLGWVIYVSVPLALPFFLIVWVVTWLWQKQHSEVKGKFRPIGQRLTERKSRAAWERTTSKSKRSFRTMVMVGTLVGETFLRLAQTFSAYWNSRFYKPYDAHCGAEWRGKNESGTVSDQTADGSGARRDDYGRQGGAGESGTVRD